MPSPPTRPVDVEALHEPFGREPENAKLRVLLVPEPDDDEQSVAVGLGELHLAEARLATQEPRVDDAIAAHESELRLGRRRMHDDSEAATGAPSGLRRRQLLLGPERRPARPRSEPHLRRIRVHERAARADADHVRRRLRERRRRDRGARGREGANHRLARGVEDVDRPVAVHREVALSAGELDRHVSRSSPASQHCEPVVHLVEHDDRAVGRDVERRRPDPRLLLAAVEPDRGVSPAPRELPHDRGRRP